MARSDKYWLNCTINASPSIDPIEVAVSTKVEPEDNNNEDEINNNINPSK